MRNGLLSTCVLFAIQMLPAYSIAGIYKCVDAGGHVAFQEQACPAQSSSSEIAIKPSPPRESQENEGESDPSSQNWDWNPETFNKEKVQVACLRGMVARKSVDPAAQRAYCNCASTAMFSDPARIRQLSENKDKKGLAKLAIKSALDCASKLL